jgi:hypothetical protein
MRVRVNQLTKHADNNRYEEDHFLPAEKIAQLLSDSMNVVPGLHHTVSKRLSRFINLRGEDSLRARTRFRKDMRKLLQGNLACPDYMTFLMQRLWHSRCVRVSRRGWMSEWVGR